MRVFVTGATGFIGSAIVQELIGSGHQVLGLARSEEAARSLIAAGAAVHRGDLNDTDSLRRGAAVSDGVIHTGFIHDFTKFKAVCETDRQAIEALGSTLAGSDRPLVVTSAIGLLTPGRLGIEEDMPPSGPNPRIASEEAADSVAAGGVRVAVVRLPASVHGEGDHGFVPILINIAREKGLSVYKGDGLNRWPAVHRLDAARLYRLVLEGAFAEAPAKAPAKIPAEATEAHAKSPAEASKAHAKAHAEAPAAAGTRGAATRFHGVAEEGIAFRDIAEVIGRRLNIPVVSKSPEEAATHFDWFAHFAGLNSPASAKQTQDRLGWRPVQPGLIADIDSDSYFSV
jgi:nucleoside-diphosphate-sugar epimerase